MRAIWRGLRPWLLSSATLCRSNTLLGFATGRFFQRRAPAWFLAHQPGAVVLAVASQSAGGAFQKCSPDSDRAVLSGITISGVALTRSKTLKLWDEWILPRKLSLAAESPFMDRGCPLFRQPRLTAVIGKKIGTEYLFWTKNPCPSRNTWSFCDEGQERGVRWYTEVL